MKNIVLQITADTSRFEAAVRRANASLAEIGLVFRRMGRQGWRMRLTTGEHHVDRIVRDCIERRLPADETALRLEVAMFVVAPVLDGDAA